MNNRRAETLSSLLLLVLGVVIVVGLVRWYFVVREIDKITAEDARMVIGTDRTLAETVQGLENTLKERIAYQFVTDKDPLDLTKVIQSQEFLEKLGADKMDPNQGVMRLATTVVGENGKVAACIIRYLGSSHVLRLGDILEGWKVVDITRNSATLRRGGERQTLPLKPASEGLSKTGQILSVSPDDALVASGNY